MNGQPQIPDSVADSVPVMNVSKMDVSTSTAWSVDTSSVPKSSASSAGTSADEDPEELNVSKGKKRLLNRHGWKRNQLKRARVAGIETETYKTKSSPAKKVGPRKQVKEFTCRCACSKKFTSEEKEAIFKRYGQFQSWSEQTLYLQGHCQPVPVARRRKKLETGGKNRETTFKYHLEKKGRSGKPVSITVCKKAFLSILGIKESRIRMKVQDNRNDHTDGRGTHSNRPNRTPPESLDRVRDFIKRLPARESHYSRKSSRPKKYLDATLTVAELHREFLSKNSDLAGTKEDHSDALIKYDRFNDIFRTEFNIGFGFPRSDLCDRCETLHAKIEAAKRDKNEKALKILEKNKEFHLQKADAFFTHMKEIKNMVKNHPNHGAICFDFEKNLPLPVTGVDPEYYYKHRLWCHNFGIYDLTTDDSTMFLYSEHYASRGPNDVISMLDWYFTNVLSPDIKHLYIFCDNCAAQNKNRYLWLYLHCQVELGRFKDIHVAYPIPGHSFMPCDQDFALIERKRKKADRVLVPSFWVNLVKNARPNQPFNVVFVEHPLTDNLENDGTPVVKVFDYKLALDKVVAASIKGICRSCKASLSQR